MLSSETLQQSKESVKEGYDKMIQTFPAAGLLDFSTDSMVTESISNTSTVNILEDLIEGSIAQARLMDKNADIDSLAHDFRTPLSIIKTNNYIINRKNLKGHELDTRMQTNSVILNTINFRLLQYIDYQNILFSPDEYSIPETFAALPSQLINDREVNYFNGNNRDVTLNELIEQFNMTELEQAMIGELVKNARFHSKAVEEKGKRVVDKDVDVSVIQVCEENRNYRVITVHDYGIGMKPSEIERIFLPSVKLEASRSADYQHRKYGYQGAGFGYTFINHIMKNIFDGEIDITSGENQGTIVTLKYPV